jgi:coenzyme Q-binding protein COQ10
MARVNTSIFIEAPVEEVFQFAIDWQKWEDWFVGVSGFRMTNPKEFGNGSRFSYKTKMLGLSVKVETEINNFVLNQGWTGKATKGMPHQTHWLFEAENSGTRFSYTLEYKLPLGFLGKFIDKYVMEPQWGKIIGTSLENLEKIFRPQKMKQSGYPTK